MGDKSPLGEKIPYGYTYSPDLLHPISREKTRRVLGLGADLPFEGEDVWNAYELTWLDSRGKPCVATAEIRVPFDSPNIIESKSMKLFLNSFSMTRYPEPDEVGSTIADDLTQAAGAEVSVFLQSLIETPGIGDLPGIRIDDQKVDCDSSDVDPELLVNANGDKVTEELHSHLLRSLCPVTDQPDTGSILIRYRGRPIDRASLLRYLVSYRNHKDFHEACVERIFLDVKSRCAPAALTVYARYNRRGGIDINPFRSDFESTAENVRLIRQ